MNGDNPPPGGAPAAPVRPAPEDFGLDPEDMGRKTARDILLSEELASVVMLAVTALAIWRFSWWGIAIACAALGLLYLARRIAEPRLKGRIDRARKAFDAAMETYEAERRAHDEAMYALERRREGPAGPPD